MTTPDQPRTKAGREVYDWLGDEFGKELLDGILEIEAEATEIATGRTSRVIQIDGIQPESGA